MNPHEDSGNRIGATVSIPLSMQTVKNSVWAYSAYVGVWPGQTFYGARIKYSYTSAGA